jgi:hypothetical protein
MGLWLAQHKRGFVQVEGCARGVVQTENIELKVGGWTVLHVHCVQVGTKIIGVSLLTVHCAAGGRHQGMGMRDVCLFVLCACHH